MNRRNAALIQDCTASVLARKSSGMFDDNRATAAAKIASTSTQSSIEPS